MSKRDRNSFASYVRSLHLTDGDILLVKSGAIDGGEEEHKAFVKDIALAIQQALGDKMPKIVILSVNDVEEIRKLDKGYMRQLGWMPVSDIGNILQNGMKHERTQ